MRFILLFLLLKYFSHSYEWDICSSIFTYFYQVAFWLVYVCSSNAELLHLACVNLVPYKSSYEVVDTNHIADYYIIMTPCI
jgi:hypothetical protein